MNILTVGGVAYMRLQQMGLKSSYNNYARTQGIVIAQDFIDTLRNNVEHFQTAGDSGYIVSNHARSKDISSINLSKKICTVSSSTDSNSNTSQSISCNTETIFDVQKAFVQQQLQSSVSNSVLCYRVKTDGFVRVTFLWKDNSAASRAINLNSLSNLKQNMVDIYAQL